MNDMLTKLATERKHQLTARALYPFVSKSGHKPDYFIKSLGINSISAVLEFQRLRPEKYL